MKKWYGLFCAIIMVWLASCSGSKTKSIFNTNAGRDSSVTFDTSPDSAAKLAGGIPDTIILKMDSTGKIGWEDRTIALSELQQELQDSLMNIYLRNGKLPMALDIRYFGTVTMGIRGDADDFIRQAQIVLRNVISVKTLNKAFGMLDSTQQSQFRKQFPVLFQAYY